MSLISRLSFFVQGSYGNRFGSGVSVDIASDFRANFTVSEPVNYYLTFDTGSFHNSAASTLNESFAFTSSSGTIVEIPLSSNPPGHGPILEYSGLLSNEEFYTITSKQRLRTMDPDPLGADADRDSRFTILFEAVKPLAIVTAVSRKFVIGLNFDIPLPTTGPAGVECRSSGAAGDYTIVFTLPNPIVSGSARVTAGVASVVGSPVCKGKTVTVQLTGVANQQIVTLELNQVTDTSAQVLADTSLAIGFLLGDTTGDGTVNSGDALGARNHSGQVADRPANYRFDVNCNFFINSGDALVVRDRSGTTLYPTTAAKQN